MRTTTTTLPNGLIDIEESPRVAVLRSLTGDQEDMIRDKRNLKDGGIIHKLLKSCLVQLGPATTPAEVEKLYDKHLTMADMTFLLVTLRMHAMGPKYSFDSKCPSCEAASHMSLDMATLRLTEQPEEFRSRALCSSTTSSGCSLEWRPLLTLHTQALETIAERYKDQRATRELLLQVVKYKGEEPTVDSLKKLEWAERLSIREAIDAGTGGYDIELECECPKCDAEYHTMMPVSMRDFFYPRAGIVSRGTARPFRSSGTTSTS
jgi:hypothetical protein